MTLKSEAEFYNCLLLLQAGFEITDSFGESSILVENLSGKDLNKTQEIPGVSYSR